MLQPLRNGDVDRALNVMMRKGNHGRMIKLAVYGYF